MNASVTRPRRAVIPALLALVIAVGVLAAPTGAHAAETDDVTWTVRTASNSFGADRTSYHYTVTPGASVDDALVVANHGTAALDLGVYAADGYTTDSGQFDLIVAGKKSRNIGAWTAGADDHIVVPAGESAEFPFTVRVPKNATPGDYAGGIVTSLVQPDTGKGINVDRRLGIRITLRVGGELAPALAVEDQHVSWSGGANPLAVGDATMSYTLHNTGNTALSANQVASLSGPFGMFAAPAPTMKAPPQLLPGEKWTVTTRFPGVGAMFALLGTATVTPRVTEASGSITDLKPITASTIGWAVPWLLIVILLMLAALVVTGLRLRTRRRAQAAEREDARVKEAVELALSGASPGRVSTAGTSPGGTSSGGTSTGDA